MASVLLVEDDPAVGILLSEFLKSEGLITALAETGYEALDLAKQDNPDVVLMDLGLPDMNGLDLIREMQPVCKNAEIIIVTGHGDAVSAMQALNLGAKDYLVKPVEKERLIVTVKNALERVELGRKVRQLSGQSADSESNKFFGIVGASNTMRNTFKLIDMAAQSHESVLIAGEQGTGKALTARTIHEIGKLQDEPFKAMNCSLAHTDEDEHEILRGITEFEKGTLYLAHISELGQNLQSKILKILESDPAFRIIASTSNTPLDEVKNKKLREDLYYRLNILPIDLPPLRQRGDDIMLLASYFLQRFSREMEKNFKDFDTPSIRILLGHHWPGNIRELQNVIKSIVSLNADEETVTARMFPRNLFDIGNETANENTQTTDRILKIPFTGEDIIPIRELEQMAISHALEVCEGNVQEAAIKLKISPATLYRKKMK